MSEYRKTYHNGQKYAFDLNKIKELCLISTQMPITDSEIQDLTNIGETEDESFVSQKILKENKYYNFQTDVIMMDLVKTFIVYMVELNSSDLVNTQETTRQESVSQSLIFNTCLDAGIIKKIDE